ncbi:hypothetical protein ATU3C_25590 [Agrobacterium genomosp. 3 str. RTP8]|nr:hypothetical protein [Agrobacterium tomkonis RTP8]
MVYYNDQIPLFIQKFVAEGEKNNLRLEEYETDNGPILTRVHKDKGYHATHLKVRSDDPSLVHVILELQIKTMLHDAWGAKMHDLTYKPTGELDPKLQQLMESFGDSLQAIEVQSETLRDAILGLQRPLQRLRRDARLIVMENLSKETIDDEKLKTAFHDCLTKIETNSAHLSICAPQDSLMIQITRAINNLIKLGLDPFIRLKLTVFLASLRDDTELAPTVDRAIQEWQKKAPADPRSAWIVSASYHQTNRLNEAIAYVRNYIAKNPADPAFLTLRHNLANYLIERCALMAPTQDARIEIKEILTANEADAANKNGPGLEAYKSTNAAYQIVFGSAEELNEGLALAYETAKSVQRVGRGYLELYIAYGWQRKLRLQ